MCSALPRDASAPGARGRAAPSSCCSMRRAAPNFDATSGSEMKNAPRKNVPMLSSPMVRTG
eukprot:3284714-Prymnesium_polylepis.1